ncbi:MAG: UvrB/UvrC motif-containing protein [Chlamydiales bacterium]
MPERPLDCTECKKPISVHYIEIIQEKVTRTGMCLNCPHLEKRLHGNTSHNTQDKKEKMADLVCGNCGTSLEAIRMGHLLGCSDCYNVFAEILVDDLFKEKRVSRHLNPSKKGQPLHIGRVQGEMTGISPTLRLITLNEAIDEMLIKEDYEQAALLRDQIRALKQKVEDEKTSE